MNQTPPHWAESWLRLLLPARDREAVSGDLLEEYRDTVRPARGGLRADAWYIAQVCGFAWRSSRGVAALLLLLFFSGPLVFNLIAPAVFRPGANWDGMVWLVPLAVLVPPSVGLLGAGAWASWRASSFWAGAAVGFFASLVVTKVLLGGFLVGLLLWQPQLLKIGMSWESLRDLTLILVSTTSAGTAIATLGGLAGTLARRSYLGIEH